jgi:DNA gyrase subunit B/topoisomerase-4 subunit B
VVLTWTDATDDKRIRSYVNGVHTSNHGTHVNGFRSAVVKAVRSYLDTHTKLVPKNVKIATEDIREGLMGIVSVFMAEPQFQGQTKARLNNPEAASTVESALYPAIEQWLNENKSIGEKAVARIASAARARQASRIAAEASRKKAKSRRRSDLPDKLADCSSSNSDECELFIVEGDSAGGSARQGRNPKTQAVLPLRGKVLNVQQASLKKLLDNRELSDIVKALGCGLGDALDLSKLNYNKVILLMDADADGDHITTLLLTFFFNYMPQLISAGHLYIARPPLFKIELGKDVYWAANEAERDKLLKKHKKNRIPKISRFKGLGEMMPKVLAKTTLDPKSRILLKVKVDNAYTTEGDLERLMGKRSDDRFEFIMLEAAKVDDLDV